MYICLPLHIKLLGPRTPLCAMRCVLISGASRGIGAAIAQRLARCRDTTVVLTGRSVETPSHSALHGTLHDVARQIRADGGRAEVVALDVRDDAQIERVVRHAVDRHGGIDVLINNASAIDVRSRPPTERVDLMHQVNARGTLLLGRACLDTLAQRKGQVVTLSPPLDSLEEWIGHAPLPYALSKYGMTLATLGLSSRVKANCLWPKRTVATAATRMLEAHSGTPFYSAGRPPSYFAEAVARLLESDHSGRALLDEELLPNDDDSAPLDMFVGAAPKNEA